jgi:hypothetical protein
MLLEFLGRLLKRSPKLPVAEPIPGVTPPPELPLTLPAPVFAEPLPTLHPREELAERCYKIGYEAACASGSPKPLTPLLDALEAQAIALAQTAHVPPSESRDQRRITRLTVLDEARESQGVDRDRSAVRLAEAKGNLARLGPGKPMPMLSAVFRYASITALAISIAPTFHDLLVGLDGFLKWTLGGLCAVGVSTLIVYGILPADRRA